MQHFYPTQGEEAVKHHPLHMDTPTLPGCLQTLGANQTGSFIVPTALMPHSPQHCNSRESPARGHSASYTREAQKQICSRGEEK